MSILEMCPPYRGVRIKRFTVCIIAKEATSQESASLSHVHHLNLRSGSGKGEARGETVL